MSSRFSQNESDIIRTCGYISDDKYIASVFGVSIYKVQRLRQKVKVKKNNTGESSPSSYTKLSDQEHRTMMERGSYRLLKSLIQFFNEREERISKGSKA